MNEKKFSVKGIYASGMVLQQKAVNVIRGTGICGKTVVLQFNNKKYKAKVNYSGEWKIKFRTPAAGGPFTLNLFQDEESIVFDDVFVGEVWVLSGQSNAQLPMTRMRFTYPEEFLLPKNNHIRMITIPISYSFGMEKDSIENPQWLTASPETLGVMSGTGYFFAKKISEELGVPVGIINSSQGGSPVTSWMKESSLVKLGKDDYLKRLDFWKNAENVSSKISSMNENQSKWNDLINSKDEGLMNKWENLSFDQLDGEWKDCVLPGVFSDIKSAAVVWFKKEFTLTKEQALALNSKNRQIWMGTIIDADKVWINGSYCGETGYCYPPRRYPVGDGVLKEGKNTVTVRVQKNGPNPIVFYEEKKYCIFNDDAVVVPVALRNVEQRSDAKCTDENFIDLKGQWKCKTGCICENAPAGMFFEWEPTALYNAMLAPCFDQTIKGALWYQGESNAGGYGEYADLLEEMIYSWRKSFKNSKKDFPVVVMQLPNWSDGKIESVPDAGCWPQLREAQRDAVESTKNTALSVNIDAGEWNDLHPEKKRTGGTRAAMQALRIGYGVKFAAPAQVHSVDSSDDSWIVTFDTDGSGLNAYALNEQCVDFKKESDSVEGFTLVQKDNGKLVNVKGKLVSNKEVMICREDLPDSCKNADFAELRYLWEDNPFYINLYNKEKVPAAPFRVKLS